MKYNSREVHTTATKVIVLRIGNTATSIYDTGMSVERLPNLRQKIYTPCKPGTLFFSSSSSRMHVIDRDVTGDRSCVTRATTPVNPTRKMQIELDVWVSVRQVLQRTC